MKLPHSIARQAAIMCRNPSFQAFLEVAVGDEPAAAEIVRRICGVKTRRELDTNPAAAQRFHELRRRFAYREVA